MLKYVLSVVAVIAIAIPVVIIFSCGGSGLPDPAPCPAPSPVAVASVPPGFDDRAAAAQAVQALFNRRIQSLTDLRDAFKKQYPTDTFFRDAAFRPDFATYADKSICTAQQMLETTSVTVGGESVGLAKPRLDTALQSFIDTMKDGRDAVASRNVSNYRSWYAAVGGRLQAIRDAFVNPSGT